MTQRDVRLFFLGCALCALLSTLPSLTVEAGDTRHGGIRVLAR